MTCVIFLHLCVSGCEPSIPCVWAADEEKRLLGSSGAVRLSALSQHFPTGVASVHSHFSKSRHADVHHVTFHQVLSRFSKFLHTSVRHTSHFRKSCHGLDLPGYSQISGFRFLSESDEKPCWGVFWIWFLTCQDSNFNLFPPMPCHASVNPVTPQ